MISIDISIKEGIVENFHLGANCSPEEVEAYTALFKELCDIFTWSYEEIPGIDPSIVVHEIKLTQVLNLYDKNFTQFILRKPRL
jgi:hypothetical protein